MTLKLPARRHPTGSARGVLGLLAGAWLLSALAGCAEAPEAGTARAETGGDAALQQVFAALEWRKTRLQDLKDIKRLQRAYGYYVDRGLWDDAADLFADDGAIEIGLDGVYSGRERVRDYLYALGGGRLGLAGGHLNEHMQLMPVITLAEDGRTALGRWRALIMGGSQEDGAFWGEGPYENRYVKEDGVWKIQKLHWFQTVVVPYEDGWLETEDMNGGIWVSDVLPPDEPPSMPYDTWPNTFLPPFHFANPVTGAVGEASAPPTGTGQEAASLEDLARRAAVLAREIERLEHQDRVENLQRIYGFYVDKGMWSEAADLFADDATLEIAGRGVYEGRDRILEFLRAQGAEFPQEGRLYDQMQLQPIVHVAPDGRTAKGRWRLFAQEAVWRESDHWGVGVYENDYVNEDGTWKIQHVRLHVTLYAPYAEGWGETALPNPGTIRMPAPDRPSAAEHEAFPAVFVAPFHYENPVTGAPVYEETPAQHAGAPAADAAELERQLAALDRQLGLLEDREQIERMHVVYGYYLARNEWDNLAAIFSSDGAIEIAMRGVYVGPESVRRNLNLYGEPGIHNGLLHNHMQYQPVIHVAEDGQTARMRSRAFSMMGQFGVYAQWMGGVYENEFVKEDGVWKLRWDQVFNTYFVPYAVGWKDATPRPPPGITEANPPDLPPSMPFEMYPGAFLPPYHYPNPVTGNAVEWSPQR